MPDINDYIHAATRDNTRKSYRSAIEHFEVQWGGFLPATAESIAKYLANYASSLSISTLKQRLAGIAAWHREQGFPDPTKAPHVKKVLKGISELHPGKPKQAKPIQLAELFQLVARFDQEIQNKNSQVSLKAKRDKAIFLLGFWRAFRSDELTKLQVENIEVEPSIGMKIFISRTKSDHVTLGKEYKVPALKQLCPVDAYVQWIKSANITAGPVFRGINRWGKINEGNLNPSSLISIVRKCCIKANLENGEVFSSHSLRRGFATWANTQGWDQKSLMEYVGWRDVNSAMRYIETSNPFAVQMLESSNSGSEKLIALS